MNPCIVGTRIKCIPILLLQLKQTSKFSEGEVFTTFLWKAAFIGSMYWGFKSFLKCSEQWQSSFKRLWWAREFMQYFPPDPQPMYKEFYRFAKLGYFLHIGKDMTFSFASCTQGRFLSKIPESSKLLPLGCHIVSSQSPPYFLRKDFLSVKLFGCFTGVPKWPVMLCWAGSINKCKSQSPKSPRPRSVCNEIKWRKSPASGLFFCHF